MKLYVNWYEIKVDIEIFIRKNFPKTYLTIAEGLSNCEVSLGQYCGL